MSNCGGPFDAAYKWLAAGINIGTMERVARDDFNVWWEMFLKGCDLRSFARGLPTNNGALLSSYIGSMHIHERKVIKAYRGHIVRPLYK